MREQLRSAGRPVADSAERPEGRRLPDHGAGRRPRAAGVQRVRRVRGPGEPGRRRPRVPARRVPGRRDRRPAHGPHRAAAAGLRQAAVQHGGPLGAGQGRLPVRRECLALRPADVEPRRHRADPRRGRRPCAAGARVALPRGRHLLRRLPHGAPHRRRLDRAPPPGHRRPLRLRLRPRLPRRAARLLPPDRPPAAAAALRPGQLVEPLPPLLRRRVPRPDGPLRRRGHPAVGRGAGHGLAPRRHRPPPRQRLDRLHLEPRPVPRPAGLPRRPARARARDDPQRAPGRGRARPRGALRRDRATDGRRPGQRAAGRLRPRGPGVPGGLPRGAAPSAGGRGRRLLVGGLAAGRRHPHPGARPAVAAQPLPLPRLRSEREAPAHVLPLRRGRQPPLPDRLLRRHGDHLGVAGLPAVLHRDREQRGLRLVEPRRRRALLRLQGRRAHRPLDPARRLLADHPAALQRQPVQHPRTVALRRAGRSGS